jgi:hypothetical protein
MLVASHSQVTPAGKQAESVFAGFERESRGMDFLLRKKERSAKP